MLSRYFKADSVSVKDLFSAYLKNLERCMIVIQQVIERSHRKQCSNKK